MTLVPPASHRELLRGNVRVWVRSDMADDLGPWLLAPTLERPTDHVACDGGRGEAYAATLAGGVRAVVRPGRRGGIVGPLWGDRYMGLRPRPLVEVIVSEAARARGLPVPSVLAARVVGGLLYQGTVVTEELPRAATLIAAVREGSSAHRRALAEAAGAVVADCHRAGLVHPDLNMTNLLVCDADPPRLAVIDLDRARIAMGPLSAVVRERMLRRLARSADKLDREHGDLDAGLRRAFHDAYASRWGAACVS